jgi:preprotein translocase subunit SecF
MMSRLRDIPGRLYRGDISVNIVGRQKMWYAISGVILLVSVAALLIRGLNFSVEFKGGSVFSFPAATSVTQGDITRVVTAAGGGQVSAQHVGGLHAHWQVTTGQLSTSITNQVQNALQNTFHVAPNAMSVQFTGPTWGSQITSKAILALIIFLVVIVLYLAFAFEWKMAVAAFTALMHDILITVGIYALIGFQVSPTSVIGLLTILGYSLYDTVVVFDKVRENTAGLLTSERSTYTQAANLALNQTLIRSINTSLTALIPVASILFIGGALLGAGTLNDLSLVLFVGMLSGTYSSLCIATPVLADLKEREPAYRKLAERLARKQAGGRAAAKATAATAAASAGGGAKATAGATAGTSGGATVTAVTTSAASAAGGGTAGGAVRETADDRADEDRAVATDDATAEATDLTAASAAAQATATRRTTVRQQPRPGSGGSQRKKRR